MMVKYEWRRLLVVVIVLRENTFGLASVNEKRIRVPLRVEGNE